MCLTKVNAEAHFELGTILLNQGNWEQAAQRFKGAAGLEKKYAGQTAQMYLDLGKASVGRMD